MTESQSKPLTLEEINAIKSRASELRAEAIANMFKALFRSLRSLSHKVATLLHLPRHA